MGESVLEFFRKQIRELELAWGVLLFVDDEPYAPFITFVEEHGVIKPRVKDHFLRSNRLLKLATRQIIDEDMYKVIKDYIMVEIMEFRFAVFMLYYFGLCMSEIVCITNFNIKEMVEKGRTLIISPTVGRVREVFVPNAARKELLQFEAEVWKVFLKFRRRKSRYVMADFRGVQFLAEDVAEVINEKFDIILDHMEVDDYVYWTVGSFRLVHYMDVRYNNHFFARTEYQNRWFYEDELEDLLFEDNYSRSYYGLEDS